MASVRRGSGAGGSHRASSCDRQPGSTPCSGSEPSSAGKHRLAYCRVLLMPEQAALAVVALLEGREPPSSQGRAWRPASCQACPMRMTEGRTGSCSACTQTPWPSSQATPACVAGWERVCCRERGRPSRAAPAWSSAGRLTGFAAPGWRLQVRRRG